MYLTMSQEVPRRHREEIMHATEFERNIRVRWRLSEDEPRIGNSWI